MHHYPQHIGDYRKHTAHLTMVEDGAYRRMLDTYYMHEKPLPADVAAVQRLASARTKEERAAVEAVLREFFTLEDDGWHNNRADEEIGVYQERAETARKNGKGGGRPPKTQKKPTAKPTDNQPGYSTETQTEPNEKLTGNRKPGTVNREPEEKGKGGAVAPSPPVAEAVALFNQTAAEHDWPRVQSMNAARTRALAVCLMDVGGFDGWQSLLAKVMASDFLMGRTARADDHANWRFTFDFLLMPKRYTKIMEGGYDNRTGSPNGTKSSHERQRQALAEWSREGDR